jgi:hypothetical protein
MKLANTPKNARLIMSIGMCFLLLALLWPRYIHLFAGHMAEATIDGWRGFLFGVSIGMNLWAVKLNAGRKRCAGS